MRFEKVDNGILIEDSIRHLLYEFEQPKPRYFRVAKEAHHALYRAMIEALRGSNNLSITGRKNKNRTVKYKFGDGPWMEIKKEKVKGCKYAWRYSQPHECSEPKSEPVEKYTSKNDDFLIDFWDALAMIQAEPFMHQYVDSRCVKVTDKEMQTLEWLHREIRNEFEHFVPKFYLAAETDLLNASKICLTIARELLFECGLILQPFLPNTLENLIDAARTKVEKRITELGK